MEFVARLVVLLRGHCLVRKRLSIPAQAKHAHFSTYRCRELCFDDLGEWQEGLRSRRWFYCIRLRSHRASLIAARDVNYFRYSTCRHDSSGRWQRISAVETDVLNRDDNCIFSLLRSDALQDRSCRNTRLARPERVVGGVSGHGSGPSRSPDLMRACTVDSLLVSLCLEHLQTQRSSRQFSDFDRS